MRKLEINSKALGLMNLEGFLRRSEINQDHLSMAFVAGGQGGGKIAAESIRMGYYGFMYNTCEQDLLDITDELERLQSHEPKIKYDTLKLEKYDGASKDRDLGLQAIKDNADLIKKRLMENKEIAESDFVWIVVALGGGTGNGSLYTVSQLVSGIMRKRKRIRMKLNPDGSIKDIGYPTVGLICAFPEADSKHQIFLNAAEALKEIRILHEKRLLGNVLLVDNEKLIENFLKQDPKEVGNLDWVAYGNTTVAQLIGELAMMTSLPGKETLDKSELLDLWSTPGFLSIGKTKINKELLNHLESLDQGELSQEIDKIVQESFVQNNVFADGFDHSKALHGALSIIQPRGGVFNARHSLLFKRALNRVLSGPRIERTHMGVFENDLFGTYKNPLTTKDQGLIYALSVTDELPERIYASVEQANKTKQMKLEIEAVERADRLSDIAAFDEGLNDNELVDLDFDAIMGVAAAADDFTSSNTIPEKQTKDSEFEEDISPFDIFND